MFAYLGVAQGPWAVAPCLEVPGGGLGKQCQVGLASSPAFGVGSSFFPPAPSESCKFSLPTGGNTQPTSKKDNKRDDTVSLNK